MKVRYNMIALSKSDFSIISFLIRNFSKRYTIRNIASALKISAPGAHAALKKMEKKEIVKSEKLGTGLFYDVNLENKAARHLASIVLLDYFEIKKIDSKEIEKESKAILFDGKNIMVITNNEDSVKDLIFKNFKELKAVCRNEESFIESLLMKEKEILDVLQKGNVLLGEEIIINAIKKVMR